MGMDKMSSRMNNWSINPGLIKMGDELGRGSFGVVRSAEWRHTPVAIKILYEDAQSQDMELFEREVKMMATLHHPHIVQFFGYTRTPALALVIELFPEGSIERYVPNSKPGAKASLKICTDMGLAIEYLHSRSPSIVIHRDIKPANFLLTASFCVKLGDFGIARARRDQSMRRVGSTQSLDHSTHSELGDSSLRGGDRPMDRDDNLTSNCGTVRFMAPEVASTDGARTSKYTAAADIFSLAMVYYFVWERILPGIAGHGTPTLHLEALYAGKRPQYHRTPKVMREIIDSMWANEGENRPNADALLKQLTNLRCKSSFGTTQIAPAT